jgi:hypothetical protein
MALRRFPKRSWGQLGPAMRALPSEQWRAFVEYYLLENPGYGAQTAAARRGGPRDSPYLWTYSRVFDFN